VRNRSDGSVEAALAGPADAVARVVAWAKLGPPAARVDKVEVSEQAGPDYTGFEVLLTT